MPFIIHRDDGYLWYFAGERLDEDGSRTLLWSGAYEYAKKYPSRKAANAAIPTASQGIPSHVVFTVHEYQGDPAGHRKTQFKR